MTVATKTIRMDGGCEAGQEQGRIIVDKT